MGLEMEKNMEINTNNKSGTLEAKVVLVIETKSTKGCGTKDNPMKIVRQYWSLKGELLPESK